MKNQHFQEFISHTKKEWKQQVIKDLKGKDFDENITWIIDENIRINAYCDGEDLHQMPLKSIQQSQNQGIKRTWNYREIIKFKSEEETNALIISLLDKGANSFLLIINGECECEFEVKKLLRNIKISAVPFFFKVENNALRLVNELQIVAPYHWKGGIENDILGRYFTSGIYDINEWKAMKEILVKVQKFPSFKTFIINGNIFHNAGANVAQEVSFTLASAIETIDRISNQNIDLLVIIKNIEFSISIGTNYFVEIAKIRSLKFLWNKILLEGYGLAQENIPPPTVHCVTSSFFNSSNSPHTNILRATTEAMSAIIGGCDSLSVRAFDETYQESDEFSSRIARNISTILREESYLDKVIDPSSGSYLIENLTFEIAENSFKLLKEVEIKGGIVEAFKHNFIQNEIKRSVENQRNELFSHKKIMVGVNKFTIDETKSNKTQKTNQLSSGLGFDLLTDVRLSSTFEK